MTGQHLCVRRVAFDIGSGMVKMGVADVRHCRATGIVVALDELSLPLHLKQTVIGLKGDLAAADNSSGGFRRPAIDRLAAAMRQMLTAAASLEPPGGGSSGGGTSGLEAVAVATQAFRDAGNGPATAAELITLLGPALSGVHIISQAEEARVGFRSAIAAAATAAADSSSRGAIHSSAVWDMGGGSFQICAEAEADADAAKGTASPAMRAHTGSVGFYQLLGGFAQIKGPMVDMASVATDPAQSAAFYPASRDECRAFEAWLHARVRVAPEYQQWFSARVASSGGSVLGEPP
eukprot:COSAG01_NODE_8935_length_2609_cov_2.003984_1_plen_292_part_00